MKNIEEVEALCVKAIDQVCKAWESLIEYIELEKFAEGLCTTKT